MSDAAEADLEEDADDIEEDAPLVRPGHGPRVGRPKGSKNTLTADLRRLIGDRPIWFLLKIVEGQRIRVGAQGGPGKGIYEYPALAERIRAATALADKVLPSLKSAEISGPEGGPVRYELADNAAAEMARIFDAIAKTKPRRQPAPAAIDLDVAVADVRRSLADRSGGPPGGGEGADSQDVDPPPTKYSNLRADTPYTDDFPSQRPPVERDPEFGVLPAGVTVKAERDGSYEIAYQGRVEFRPADRASCELVLPQLLEQWGLS